MPARSGLPSRLRIRRWSRRPLPGKTPIGAGEPADRDKLSIRFGDLLVASEGERAPIYDEAATSAYMKGEELELTVSLGLGEGRATVYTCDLTHGYITINGDYRS